ncbi:Coatomer subunit delta [Papilio machaon]|uniref:Coatomer subunit delta n=1 Tax=Papilio machaon TaxID=76193 RepID=A0A0N1PJU3_PAPMA|nr:Coatomer subunit delta [Papilio machaon]
MSSSSPIAEKLPTTPVRETQAASSAMKLSSRGADVDSFVSRLAKEGDVAALTPQVTTVAKDKAPIPADHKEPNGILNTTLYDTCQTHPNVDKEAFRSSGVIGLKQVQRPFPMHSDVGVLKWRLTTGNDDKLAPLSGRTLVIIKYFEKKGKKY